MSKFSKMRLSDIHEAGWRLEITDPRAEAAAREVEIAHAVALERKAVVRFLRGWDTCGEHCASFRAARTLAEAIEKGEHNG